MTTERRPACSLPDCRSIAGFAVRALVVTGSVGGLVGGCDAAPALAPAALFPVAAATDWQEVRSCRFSVEHDGVHIRVVADAVAATPYLAAQYPLPVGSRVVKVEYDDAKCSHRVGFTAMRKSSAGLWEWQRTDANAGVQAMDPARCVGCHKAACVATDFVCTHP
ncbi:MAG: hypothetical protein EXR79_11015 [Myxococcales bacterium]|nr:hypothetical protein [Myxococcales bacterium]